MKEYTYEGRVVKDLISGLYGPVIEVERIAPGEMKLKIDFGGAIWGIIEGLNVIRGVDWDFV